MSLLSSKERPASHRRGWRFVSGWTAHFRLNPMNAFIDNLKEVFALFGPVRARKMFGGYGLYHDDLMFGLVADEVLYLKADEKSVDAFAAEGLGPFEYEKNGKVVKMSYYLAPEAIFDDPEVAREWAIKAFDAALRSKKVKGRSRKTGN